MMHIKGYAIIDLLSQREAMHVYRAKRESDGLPVVLKILSVEFPTPLQLAHIKHEYNLLHGINHQGIIKVYALEKLNNSYAVVMEDFGGKALKAIIADERLTLEVTLKIALQVAIALVEIHEKGLLHKDINPSNILFNHLTGMAKIIDFGIASTYSHKEEFLESPEHLEGTLAYIAPEQTGRMNRSVDYRCDFYALGITLYEMLSGELPFKTDDSMEMVHQHMAAVAITLNDKDGSSPLVISRIIEKLMEKNAESRYQSAACLCKDLELCLASIDDLSVMNDFVPALHDVSDRFILPVKLYGREKEVVVLMDGYAQACLGKPSIMLITGYSGIGKSSLINEIHKPIAKQKGFFASGKYDQYRRNIPYSGLIQTFQSLILQILTESNARIAAWREDLLAALGNNGQVIINVIPELQHIIGEQPDLPTLEAKETRNRFDLYFINFVQVFTRSGHSLVLFLDDLQWVDVASLNMLELLSNNANCKHLFIIAAYRENEVDASHSLPRTLANMKASGVVLKGIALETLSLDTVCEIAADTLHSTKDSCQQLASLLFKKTGGNPFFIYQVLKKLYDENLLFFTPSKRVWDWDIAKIEQVEISDNIVVLMIGAIQKLPPSVQTLLKLAACIGYRFYLSELAVLSKTSCAKLTTMFHAALQAALIVPIGEAYKFVENSNDFDACYHFSHDRIQQAAYSLLTPDELLHAHLDVGQLLLKSTSEKLIDKKLFDIVNHFNRASSLIHDRPLQQQLATLNFKASIKAKNSAAYQPALTYVKAAQNYLDHSPQENYALAFNLLLEQAECEYLNANNTEAEKLFLQALSKAKNQQEKIVVYEHLVHYYTNITEFNKAYQIGREALKVLGVSLPESFVPPLFILDLAKAKWHMRGKKVADLIHLPLCENESMRIAMRLIGALLKAAYQIRPELCIANAVKAVNLSLIYGTTEDNAVAYVVFGGIFMGGVLGKHQTGYDFGQLALAMNARFDNVKQRSEVNFVAAYFTHFWLKPAAKTERYYQEAYDHGMQIGDFFHVSCAACTMVESQFIRGVPLVEVKKLGNDYLTFVQRIKNHESAGTITAVLRTILNLEGVTKSPDSFSDDDFDEQAFVERIKQFTSQHFTHFYFVNKMQSLYLWGLHEQALDVAKESEKYLKHSLAMLHTVEHHFYYALILCAVYRLNKQKRLLKKARGIERKFQKWTQLNPENFKHKALLIKAELTRASQGGVHIAARYYNDAIKAAGESGSIQVKALAHELAGRFYAASHIDMAVQGHLKAAYYGYTMWGALGIAEKLRTEFSLTTRSAREEDHQHGGATTFSNVSRTTHKKTTMDRPFSKTRSNAQSGSKLDLETVIKSTQIISSEIKLSSLLQSLMNIIIENAGAQKGCFIRVDQDQLLMEVEASLGDAKVKVLADKTMDNLKLPASIVRYVFRTSESIVLNQASTDSRFALDSYIVHNQSKSVLCSPIIHHGQVIAIIYLENNLSVGVFTPARLEVLNLLSAQAAISIENSLLYENLEQRVELRTHELKFALDKLNIAHSSIQSSIQYASRIQRSVLPQENYINQIIPDSFILWEPRDIVGGDIYWCKPWGDGHLIILGDCTGHGVPGAFMTLLSTGALERAMNEVPPANISALLQHTHRVLQQILNQKSKGGQSDDGIEMGVCYLNHDRTILRFAGARFDLFILKNGQIEVIKGTRSSMGYRGIPWDRTFNTHDITVDQGMTFYMTSDGIIDQLGVKIRWGVGKKRLARWLIEAGSLPIKEQKRYIYQKLLTYQGDATRRDDVSMVGFRV